jgi:hypothetical protein
LSTSIRGPVADPVLFWPGKRDRRQAPVLPLQRNEIVSESRIAQIIGRARRAGEEKSNSRRQGHLFADLEKSLRESAMCGRLRVGKKNLHVAGLVGAAMCSAFRCGSHDRWP